MYEWLTNRPPCGKENPVRWPILLNSYRKKAEKCKKMMEILQFDGMIER